MLPVPSLVRISLVAASLVGSVAAFAQSVQPQVPGFQPPAPSTQPVRPAGVSGAANEPAAEPKTVKSEVERHGRTGFDTFLATYLTLSKECKIGTNPKIDVTVPPKNGKINIRPNAINLRSVPGAPKTNCIGVSPSGVGVFYRAERKFKGEETFTYRVIYPTGDIREVTAKVITQ